MSRLAAVLTFIATCGALVACSAEKVDSPPPPATQAKPEPVAPVPAAQSPSPVTQTPASQTPPLREGKAPQWPVERPTPSRVAAVADTVTLTTEGAEPRRVLKITVPKGSKQTVGLRMDLQVAMSLGGKRIDPARLPALGVALDVSEKSTAADGTTTWDFVVTRSERERQEDASPRLLAAMDKAVEGMRDAKGTLQTDAQGRVVNVDYGLPELPTPGLRPSFAGFQQSFSQLFPILPSEEVGVGASWEATQRFELSGVPVQQRATYTIESIEDDVVALAVRFEQSATGDIEAPPTVALEGTGFGGRGEGTVTLGLDSPFPRSAVATARTVTVSEVSMGGGTQAVEMDLLSTLSIGPVAAGG